MFKKLLFIVLLFSPGLLFAQEAVTEENLEEILGVKIRLANHIAYNPNVIQAVELQNRQNLSISEIQNRDTEWVEMTGRNTSLRLGITNSELADYFKRRVDNNDAIAEIFLTDNQGANVAAYPATSDYWQGDEEKWTASFNNGDGKLFIGPLELDESTQKTLVQISAPVVSQQKTIGVLVMGVSIEYLSAQ